MKRQRTNAVITLPNSVSWSIVVFISTMCFLSCACRNKASLPSVEQTSSTAKTNQEGSTANTFAPKELVENTYASVLAAVKAKEGYSLFGEFLERGKYHNAFMRLDILQYQFIIPSDQAIKKLDNATFTQLIYPDMASQANVEFLHRHLAFGAQAAGASRTYRTMVNKTVNLEDNNKTLKVDGKRFAVVDKTAVSASVNLIFIDDLIEQ